MTIEVNKEEQRRKVQADNEKYRERFQFVLSINDDIICQRYFKVNGFSSESLHSFELKEAVGEVVNMIKKELSEKTHEFLWITSNLPLKLNGFADQSETEMFTYGDEIEDPFEDTYRAEPWEFTFRFKLIVDENVVYDWIWDGGDYPKFIRNSVDLTNTDPGAKDSDIPIPVSTFFVLRKLNSNRGDTTYKIIRKLCDAMSVSKDERPNFTESDMYGDVEYFFTPYSRKYVSAWRKSVQDKTKEYYIKMYPSDKAIERLERQ